MHHASGRHLTVTFETGVIPSPILIKILTHSKLFQWTMEWTDVQNIAIAGCSYWLAHILRWCGFYKRRSESGESDPHKSIILPHPLKNRLGLPWWETYTICRGDRSPISSSSQHLFHHLNVKWVLRSLNEKRKIAIRWPSQNIRLDPHLVGDHSYLLVLRKSVLKRMFCWECLNKLCHLLNPRLARTFFRYRYRGWMEGLF